MNDVNDLIFLGISHHFFNRVFDIFPVYEKKDCSFGLEDMKAVIAICSILHGIADDLRDVYREEDIAKNKETMIGLDEAIRFIGKNISLLKNKFLKEAILEALDEFHSMLVDIEQNKQEGFKSKAYKYFLYGVY